MNEQEVTRNLPDRHTLQSLPNWQPGHVNGCAEEVQKAPARIAINDAFMLVKWVAGIWKSRLQAQVQDGCQGGVVVVETGLQAPQEHLSQAIQAIYSKELCCTPDNVGSFLYITDYLQVIHSRARLGDCALVCLLSCVMVPCLTHAKDLCASASDRFSKVNILPL